MRSKDSSRGDRQTTSEPAGRNRAPSKVTALDASERWGESAAAPHDASAGKREDQHAGTWEMTPELCAALGLSDSATPAAPDAAGSASTTVEVEAARLVEVLRARGEVDEDERDGEAEDSRDATLDVGPVQKQLAAPDGQSAAAVGPTALAGFSGSAGRLPHLDLIQRSFGHHEVGDVHAHMGGPAAASASTLGATAYAAGNHVAFAEAPSLHTAAHEAAHVIQQRAGAATAQNAGRAGDPFERHADRVADMVVAGQSAEAALDEMASSGGGSACEVVQHEGGLPEPPFSDDKLRPLTKEQLQELYDKYHRTNPGEANKVKKWQKSMGFRGSSVKKGGKAKKFLRKAGKAAKVIVPLIFLHDWYEHGFWEASKNTANDVLWPLSELWN